MRALLTGLLALAFAICGPAQERRVSLQLEGGERIEGSVVAMDTNQLQVRVDGVVRTIEARRIAECRFAPVEAPASGETDPAAAPPEADPAAAGTATTAPPAPASGADAKAKPVARARWSRPLPDPVDPTAAQQLPHDVRHQSLLRRRLQALDEAYPWLQPTAPMQWLSLGLLTAILLSLGVYGSVKIAGAEGATMGLSFGLASCILFTGVVQVALVPCNHLTVALMLLANPTLALFCLTGMFGLTRVAASIAFAVQLGFAALAWGLLELVTSVLASIGAPVT